MSTMLTHARVAPITAVHRARGRAGTARRLSPTLASEEARGKIDVEVRKMPRRAALALSASASLATGAAAFGVSAASATGELTTPKFVNKLVDGGLGTRNRVVFHDIQVSIPGSGQRVPVATWCPGERDSPFSDGDGADDETPAAYYPHQISIAKIARVLLNTPETTPTWLDRQMPLRASAGVSFLVSAGSGAVAVPATAKGVAVLCHGYLGSRFDLLDLAEFLAQEGFVVIAPEFAESLADPATTPAYARPGKPPPANPSATRDEIVKAAVRAFVPNFYDGTSQVKVVIAGQSAGASTATSSPGDFAARVAIAGFRPPEVVDRDSSLARNPLLIVASAGDGVISLYPKEKSAFGPYEGIEIGVAKFFAANGGTKYGKYDLEQFASRIDEAKVFVTYELPGGSGNADTENTSSLPCHISFLSSRTNDAMVEVLSPLLPVARLLGVPVLDFDKYQLTKDSDAVNGALVPLIAKWLTQAVDV